MASLDREWAVEQIDAFLHSSDRVVSSTPGVIGAFQREPDKVVADLTDRASGLRDTFTDWRLTAQRLATIQQALAQDEERAARIAVFQVGVVPGLLQTTEYKRRSIIPLRWHRKLLSMP